MEKGNGKQINKNQLKLFKDSPLYHKIVTNKNVEKRLPIHILYDFFEKYKGSFCLYSSSDLQNILPSRFKKSKFQKDFINLIKVAYGDHAEIILKERPNLTLNNIYNFIVFEPCIYENFGKNFVNQLINFDYNYVTKNKYNDILVKIVENPNILEGFKYCFNFIKSNNKDEVYNYSKLFNIFYNYESIFVDCAKHKNEMTPQIKGYLQDLIIDKNNELEIKSFRELKAYPEISKQYFDRTVMIAVQTRHQDLIKEAIMNRFFGLRYKFYDECYRRSNNTLSSIKKFYNLSHILAYEENIRRFKGVNAKPHFSKSEISYLKLVNTFIKTMTGSNYLSLNDWAELYKMLDENSDLIVRPSDGRAIIDKIPQVCKNEMVKTLITIDGLENAILHKEKGVRKSYITAINSKGKEITIPVYHLEGKPFATLMTSVDSNLSINRDRNSNGATKTESWFEYENGISHISCSYVTETIRAGLEFKGLSDNEINYMLGKNIDIIAMGYDDIFSSFLERDPDVYSKECTKFSMPNELLAESEAGAYYYNEITVERYSLLEKRGACKILPEAIIKVGKVPAEEIVNHAIEFSEYVKKHHIRGKDFVLPIIMIDTSKYLDKQIEEEKDILIEQQALLCELSNKYLKNKNIFKSFKDLTNSILKEQKEDNKKDKDNSKYNSQQTNSETEMGENF